MATGQPFYDSEEGVTGRASDAPASDSVRGPDSTAPSPESAAALDLALTLDMAARKKEGVEETMRLLTREVREAQFRRRERIVKRLFSVAIVIWMCALFRYQFYYGLWFIGIFGGGAWAADSAVGKRREAAHKLSEAGDPRAVGAMAVALQDGDPYVRRSAEKTLRALLPRVRPSDAAYVDAEQMTALLRLADHSEAPLRIALLKGLEQIGDARAMEAVHKLKRDPVLMVQEQAEASRDLILKRVRRARESATLLRASSANEAYPGAEQLLRPAGYVSEARDSELLRPASPPGDGIES